MTDEVLGTQGCLAMIVAIAFAALLLMVGLFAPFAISLPLYVAVFLVTALIVGLVGVPLYLLALRLRRTDIWAASLAGAITGAIFPLINTLSVDAAKAWAGAAGYALVGATSGIVFYLTATAPRTPRRNIALLLVLAGVTVAAATIWRETWGALQ